MQQYAQAIIFGEQLNPWKVEKSVNIRGLLEADADPAHGAVEQRCGLDHFDDLTLANDGRPVGDDLHFADDVRGEEDRCPVILGFGQHAQNFLLHERVKATGGLVEQQ